MMVRGGRHSADELSGYVGKWNVVGGGNEVSGKSSVVR